MKIYRTSPDEDLRRVSREAAEWVQAMKDEPSQDERGAFMDWVGASPLHVREALIADTLDEALDRPGLLDSFDLDQVLAAATDAGNVVALHPQGQQASALPPIAATPAPAETVSGPSTGPAAATAAITGGMSHRQRPRARGLRHWGRAAAMVAIFAIGMATWWFGDDIVPGKLYATAIGEQRVISLEDGSRVTLAPRSSITVAFSDGARDIVLKTGEADFKVAHDKTRPFRVHAGASVIQAVGTQFSVNRLPSGTIVAVSEGKVRMLSRADLGVDGSIKQWLDWSRDDGEHFAPDVQPKPLDEQSSLVAGDAVKIAASGRVYASVDYRDARDTRSAMPRLTFHEDTLADIVTQFNRYNARQIVLDDADARWQRYSGVFNASDAESFLQFLECCSNLQVSRDGEQTRIQTGLSRLQRD